MNGALDLEDVRGNLSAWLQREEVVKWIKRHFSNFLRDFLDESGANVYEQRINEMCSNNK